MDEPTFEEWSKDYPMLENEPLPECTKHELRGGNEKKWEPCYDTGHRWKPYQSKYNRVPRCTHCGIKFHK